ncbi:MAG: AI-2E family transporter [Ginsengibacter sp.]
MADSDPSQQPDKLTFTKKVWIAGGIISLIIVFILLITTLFSVVLLILAGVLVAIYFHGCADILKKYLHCPSRLSVVISIITNVLLLIAFFWFVGDRLSTQVSQLSDSLPTIIQKAKVQMSHSAIGNKVLQYLNSSGNSEKTMVVAKRFFSSGFGILLDLYIIFIFGLFFTAGSTLYKKGIISLLPTDAKDKGLEIINELGNALKKWLEGQIIAFFFIAIFTGIGFLILGMPLVFTLALIAGLSAFIPNFGPLLAFVPAALIALAQSQKTLVIVACIFIVVHLIENAILLPLIQKKMVKVLPAVTIFAQVALGLLGGFWGVLLAVPVVVVLKTIIVKLYIEQKPVPNKN